MKILVVDDEELIRNVIREYLIMEEYTVDEANDGLEAITKAKENDYNFLDENSIHGNFKNIKIRRKDGMPFAMNMDGELSGEFCDWEAEIVPGGLHLVVPGGVKM
mgnify:CR=1 FL=1